MSAFYTKKAFLVLFYLFIGTSCSDSDFYFKSFELENTNQNKFVLFEMLDYEKKGVCLQ